MADDRDWRNLDTAIRRWNDNARRPVILVLAGRRGAGKSTLVNNFLGLQGERRAKARASVRAVTLELGEHHKEVNGIQVRIIDTPGLEATSQTERDEKVSLAMLSEYTSGRADMLLYFVSMKEGRFEEETHARIIKKLNESFTNKIWERTLLILTHADIVVDEDDEDEPALSELANDYCKEFLKVLQKCRVPTITNIQCVPPPGANQWANPVENSTLLAVPVGKRLEKPPEWKTSLIKAVLEKCDMDAIPALLELQGVLWEEMKYQITTWGVQQASILAGEAIGGAVAGEIGREIGQYVGHAAGQVLASHAGNACNYARIIEARRRVAEMRNRAN